MSKEALHTAEEREVKGKGEKERYTKLQVEFQRIASRYKKDFLSEQQEKQRKKNRMGMAIDLFKKIRDMKKIFHAKMSTKKTETVRT